MVAEIFEAELLRQLPQSTSDYYHSDTQHTDSKVSLASWHLQDLLAHNKNVNRFILDEI